MVLYNEAGKDKMLNVVRKKKTCKSKKAMVRMRTDLSSEIMKVRIQ